MLTLRRDDISGGGEKHGDNSVICAGGLGSSDAVPGTGGWQGLVPGGERSTHRSRQARKCTLCSGPAWLKGNKVQGNMQLLLRPEQYSMFRVRSLFLIQMRTGNTKRGVL